ncbi:MAG: Gx transporter family protein [Actinomycetota bacterium]|nr:Gx transporter family protein [Actinomycetota bacterium]
MKTNRRVTSLALFVSVGLVLNIIENSFPPLFPIPGAKLGLANIATVMALYLYDSTMALEVAIIRGLLGGILRGNVMGLILSFSAGLVSTAFMIGVKAAGKRHVSILGVSIAGAVVHNIAQISVAFLLIRETALFLYTPYMILVAIPTGLFIGYASRKTCSSLENLTLAKG